jgi:zinc protease
MRSPARLLLAVVAAAVLCAPAGAGTLTLPAVRKATLKNGLTVFVMPTRRLPLVDLRLVARAGSVNDPPGKEGLASLTADLLTEGAAGRTAKQIAEEVAFVGATLDAGAGTEQFVVSAEMLDKDFDTVLGLFHDVIVSPRFPTEEFVRKRDAKLGELASQRNDPGTIANNELGPFLLTESPLAHPPAGWPSTVATLTREDVAAFHARFVAPGNAMLAVVGDVDPARVMKELERVFADWEPAPPTHAPDTAPPPLKGRQVLIVSKPEVTQTQIRLAALGVPRNSPDYFPIVVANTVLGGGFTSRLVNEIRVVQGLTYSISSRFGMFRDAGTYTISTFTKNESMRKAIDGSLAVVHGLVEQGPTDEEVGKAKRYLTGQFPLGLQAPDALAAQLLNIAFYGLDPDYLQTYAARVNAVTTADVRRVLKSVFKLDDLRILVVSNPKVARPALEGLGTIAVKEIR